METIKITTDFSGNNIGINKLVINKRINELPTASISIDGSKINPNDILNEEIEIKYNDKPIFKGVCNGAQPYSSHSSIGYDVSLIGGPIRLVRSSALFLGLQTFGLQTDANTNLSTLLLSLTAAFNNQFYNNVFEFFKKFITVTYAYIEKQMSSVNTFTNKTQEAILQMYKNVNKELSSIFLEELNKIDTSKMKSLNMQSMPINVSELEALCLTPGISFWTMLQHFLSMYQVGFGSDGITNYVFPISPLEKPSKAIETNTISSMQVMPLPLSFDTRVVLTINNQLVPTVLESVGYYPPLSQSSSITQLEKKFRIISVKHINLPPYTVGANNIKQIDVDSMAKMYYMSNLLSNRGATLITKYLTGINIGDIISFVDKEFGNRKYQGHVVAKIDDFSSMTSSISAQHIFSEDEKTLFDIENTSNPIFA